MVVEIQIGEFKVSDDNPETTLRDIEKTINRLLKKHTDLWNKVKKLEKTEKYIN